MIIFPVHFHTGVDKGWLCAAQFGTATDTITDLLKVDQVLSKRVTSRFFVIVGA